MCRTYREGANCREHQGACRQDSEKNAESGGTPDDEYADYISTLLKWRQRVTAEQVVDVLGGVDPNEVAQLVDVVARIRHEYGHEEREDD